MSDSYKELEFKYKADEVSLSKFVKVIEELKPIKRLDISSWDTYFVKHTPSQKEVDYFVRFRESDTPELTKKRKIKKENNWERLEIDLPLDKNATEKIVEDFVNLDGYEKNFKIYKTCFIFWFDLFNVVYYLVYDENMKEQGKFIEIEINKDKVESLGLEEAKELLVNMEKETLSKLNINHKNRMRNSLFELFRKENK